MHNDKFPTFQNHKTPPKSKFDNLHKTIIKKPPNHSCINNGTFAAY